MAAVKMAVAPVLFLWYITVSMVSACVPPSCVYVTQKPEEVWGRHAFSLSFNTRLSTCIQPINVRAQGKGKGNPYSIIERRVPELIPALCSQPAGDVSHKPGGRLPLLSARPAVTPTTLKRAATNFSDW